MGLARTDSGLVLNLGSGRKQISGAVNVDRNPEVKPQIILDLDSIPWPFPDHTFDEIVAFDVIEHLDRIVSAMDEIYRVSRDGAKIRITVPHFSCANTFTDPTHRHQFGWLSFHFFTGESDTPLSAQSKFKRLQTRINFYPSLMNKLIWRLANRWPEAYEKRWTWMFPAWFLYVELQTVKPKSSA